MERVYLDHNATTPLDRRVFEAMEPWLTSRHGNASSIHGFGQEARAAVEAARAAVARLLGGVPAQCVFTASGTEALNAVVASVAESAGGRGRLVVSSLEHPAVQAAAERASASGLELVRVAPNRAGVVEPEAVERALGDGAVLVCLMLANNEIGTLQPVEEVARLCRARSVPILCDAVQAVGKHQVNAEDLEVDYLVLGAHKLQGPLGAAALWVRGGAAFEPLLVGGSQERRRRAGTENVAAIVGLGRAIELVEAELDERIAKLARLRDRFEAALTGLEDVVVHGSAAPRLPNTSNVAFPGAPASSLVIRLDLAGFAVSGGSACSSGKAKPSSALMSMGVSEAEALASVRVSFGPSNTLDETDRFAAAVLREVRELRRLAAVG